MSLRAQRRRVRMFTPACECFWTVGGAMSSCCPLNRRGVKLPRICGTPIDRVDQATTILERSSKAHFHNPQLPGQGSPRSLVFYTTAHLTFTSVYGALFGQGRRYLAWLEGRQRGRRRDHSPEKTSPYQESAAFPSFATSNRDHRPHSILRRGRYGTSPRLATNHQHLPPHSRHHVLLT